MTFLKKKENQLVILILLSVVLYLFSPDFFWQISLTPYIKPEIISKIPEGLERAIKSHDFYDLRYLQYISIYFDNIYSPSDQLYNLYKNHDSTMVVNYPRIWIAISHFINLKSDFILYSFYIVFFILYSYIFFYFTKISNSYFFVYLFFCGSNLLLLERGNVDFILITIVFYSFFSKLKFFNYFGYLLVSFLKFYPAFSLLFFLENKKSIIKIILLSSIFLIYLFLTQDDIRNINLVNPITGHSSYGFLSLITNMKVYTSIDLNYMFVITLNLIFIFLIYLISKSKFKNAEFKYTNIFLIGGGIFVFTFLINTHHDYRMMFLIFCIPLLLNLKNNIIKVFALFCIILSLELQKLLIVFGFFGGVINSLAKLILFYIIFLIYFDIINKKIKKIFFNKI
tara:strand:+ start:2390 stop:3580 length:1191 start_codon:yes stop_codon:yes gene_type:complete